MLRRSNLGVIFFACASALAACATTAAQPDKPVTEQIQTSGLSQPALEVASDKTVNFVNSDQRPHQIYSNDCNELSSMVILPGQQYSTLVGEGPKTCHYEDLLDPTSPLYMGTFSVKRPPESEYNWAP